VRREFGDRPQLEAAGTVLEDVVLDMRREFHVCPPEVVPCTGAGFNALPYIVEHVRNLLGNWASLNPGDHIEGERVFSVPQEGGFPSGSRRE
jgi:hypothetical protein